MFNHLRHTFSQDLGQIGAHLSRHHERHTVVAIVAEREAHIVALQFGLLLVAHLSQEVERAVTQQLPLPQPLNGCTSPTRGLSGIT